MSNEKTLATIINIMMVLSVSFQSYFRYCIYDSLSLFHYFLFLLWPRSEHFRSAVLCRAHKIKMYFVRHNYVKWKYVCLCVGFSNQIYKHFSRKVFWCKCKSCNWQTIAPLFRLNSIWVCWLHWLLKCNFHRFYHSGKFDGKIDIIVSTSGILVVLLWCFLRANFTVFSAKYSDIHFENSKTTGIVCSNRVQF